MTNIELALFIALALLFTSLTNMVVGLVFNKETYMNVSFIIVIASFFVFILTIVYGLITYPTPQTYLRCY